MALATYRNKDTGDLVELSDRWLDRFPDDPYTRVSTDELAKIEAEQRQADIAAIGAKPFDQGQDAPAPSAPAPAASDEDGDTPSTITDPRDARRF